MKPVDIDIETLIPHRDRMKLVQEVIEITPQEARTGAIVQDTWPCVDEHGASSLVLIELVAQSAAVCIGWQEMQNGHDPAGGRGWLVGVKSADFFMDRIALGWRVVTRAWPAFSHLNLIEIHGSASVDQMPIGEVVLQVFREDAAPA